MSSGLLANVPVGNEERLARFVLTDKHIRKSDGTVKAEAILPFKWVELSVCRHAGVTEEELWALGKEVADTIAMPSVLIAAAGKEAIIPPRCNRRHLAVYPPVPTRSRPRFE